MANWKSNNKETMEVDRYTPKDLTNSKDFTKELHNIDSNQTLTVLDKYKYKKQLMRTVFAAKQMEIAHHLDSYQNYLMARKDVEGKTITLEAQKAIMLLEKEQLQMMKEMGLSHSDEISNTLIKAGNMLTDKLREVEGSTMEPDIKIMVLGNIRTVWNKTNNRILESVDTYMDELYEKERGRLMDRVGYKIILVVDTVILFFLCLVYGFSHNIFSHEIAFVVVSIAFVLDAMLFMAGMARAKYVQTLADSKEEVTTTLSAGISINHLISIIIAIGGGLLWESLGIEVLFSMAALFGLGSFVFSLFLPGDSGELVTE